MTWLEFKELVEKNGVKDYMEIDYIDVASASVSLKKDDECLDVHIRDVDGLESFRIEG